jgi:hypothetical protein
VIGAIAAAVFLLVGVVALFTLGGGGESTPSIQVEGESVTRGVAATTAPTDSVAPTAGTASPDPSSSTPTTGAAVAGRTSGTTTTAGGGVPDPGASSAAVAPAPAPAPAPEPTTTTPALAPWISLSSGSGGALVVSIGGLYPSTTYSMSCFHIIVGEGPSQFSAYSATTDGSGASTTSNCVWNQPDTHAYVIVTGPGISGILGSSHLYFSA